MGRSELTDELLSPEQVAQHCGLSRKAVYRAIERGELKASKLCSRLRIRREDVETWIDRSRVSPADAVIGLAAAPLPAPNGLRSLLAKSEAQQNV